VITNHHKASSKPRQNVIVEQWCVGKAHLNLDNHHQGADELHAGVRDVAS
jgi:hypothetical protein